MNQLKLYSYFRSRDRSLIRIEEPTKQNCVGKINETTRESLGQSTVTP
ncbi:MULTISPECIES: hypothetical protein [Nostocales]|uniref:Uncharacterized protein n=3 Tax=Nostocales TaxID=1161 RepID=A0A8S9T480_9CYAN|nr:hypothetical protein [Tolypothrix bouteillei]KAF3886349.1 hypothetical protein DA73_0400013330 [Tolypothrix bouteillei VB521301]